MEIFTSNSEIETIKIGFNIAEKLKLGDVVTLEGELGAGKTELIKGICRYFEVEGHITSPTFTIINQYEGRLDNFNFTIFHLDLYRIKNIEELTEIGFYECLSDDNSIKLIEWPNKAGNKLENPNVRIKILLDEKNENKRKIQIEYI